MEKKFNFESVNLANKNASRKEEEKKTILNTNDSTKTLYSTKTNGKKPWER